MPAPHTIDLLIHGSSEVVTPLGQAALTGAGLGGVAVTRDGALAVATMAYERGAAILRVHDVREHVQALRAASSIAAAGQQVELDSL